MTRQYKTLGHAERAVEASSVSAWSWGSMDKIKTIRRLVVWLFLQDIRLTDGAIHKFVTEELGQDAKKYNVLKGN